MSARITASRRRAFLNALEQTGNQTLSAERAKVSRSWVCLQRSSDAGFDAACREALAVARLWVGDSDNHKPGLARWARHDGHELVVRGTNGRRLQIARARIKQWSPTVELRFLEALAATCNVKAAAREAGMSQSSAYAHRQRWPAFARHWDDAIVVGYAGLEAALIEGAIAFMEGEPPELGGPIRVTSVGEAIQALVMNRFAVTGIGKKRR